MRLLHTSVLALAIGFLFAAPISAQESPGPEGGSILSAAALDAALAGHESVANQQRTRMSEVLSDAQVQRLARDRGIDIGQVQAAAAGLSDAQVGAVAPLVERVLPVIQDGLGTVTISVAAIIIILLVLILVT